MSDEDDISIFLGQETCTQIFGGIVLSGKKFLKVDFRITLTDNNSLLLFNWFSLLLLLLLLGLVAFFALFLIEFEVVSIHLLLEVV